MIIFQANGKTYQTTQEIYNLLQSVKTSITAFLMVWIIEEMKGNIKEVTA